MAKVLVDGKEFEAREGTNLLQAVLSESIDLPYFCWHPAMGSVGACRQCAVIQYTDESDERGRLTMACMTPVMDGMRISVEAAHAADFRQSVIEWLMENHPHDCPVCEEGGECHLQDMTVMTGHSVRRYKDQKRTWRNQNLGPLIGHEMNRCITCYRCDRFYNEYAGGSDLAALGSKDRVFFGRVEDGTLESEFAGNLVEVCPTGVFTDKPFSSHYTRKWDLQSAPSVCQGCAVGCNTIASERYGILKRVHNRYHDQVNRYFLCDRGRFGSHYINSEDRIRHVGIRGEDGVFEYGDQQEAINLVADKTKTECVGIGSPRASLEANFALQQLVGKENFCNGLSTIEAELSQLTDDITEKGGFKLPSVTEIEAADAIVILGEDVSNTAARVALAIRQATRVVSFEMAQDASIPSWQDAGVRGHAQHARSPLFISSNVPTRLDSIASETLTANATEIAQTGFEIAAKCNPEFAGQASTSSDFVAHAADALRSASNPLIVAGHGLGNADCLRAAANIAWALKANGCTANLLILPLEANSSGVSLLEGSLSLTEALAKMQAGQSAIVVENDLYRRAPKSDVDAAISGTSALIALDSNANQLAGQATAVLPAATVAEQTGTYVNYEFRAQRFYQVFEPKDDIKASWSWIVDIAKASDQSDFGWTSSDAVIDACSQELGKQLTDVAPSADYRYQESFKIARQTHRYSGRTAMNANDSVHEPKSTEDPDTPLTYSMEGENPGTQNGSVVPYLWTPGWNSNQSVFKFQQEVAGPLLGGDPGVHVREIRQATPLPTPYDYQPSDNSESSSELRIELAHDVFGSGELTSLSWPLQARMPAPTAWLNPTDASTRGLSEEAGVKLDETSPTFEVRLSDRVPRGTVAVTADMLPSYSLALETSQLIVDSAYQSKSARQEKIIASA